ncbi:MAG TPA: GatB/YqeY domain-containing protein [Candidatus Paceibacterota bacterium]|nr:GatB/YqeY domain-containing protein [Candidatus Paceibacterota bacterium]
MSLYEQLTADLKTAMKAGDQPRVDALRFALAGINSFQKDKQAKQPGAAITDEELISVLQKDVKRRRESIELFRQGKRDDLVAKEEADLAIISAYLPKELTRAEIGKIVDGVIAAGAKDFNAAMREAMKAVKGRADGRAVGEVIREKLG